MKEVDVLILFEHRAREFESACLLKYEFEKRGYTAIIEGAFPNREMLPLRYKVKYLVTPWYYTGTKYVANFLKNSPNAIIINMHHEQYTIENSDILIPKGEARYVYHVAWGDAFKDQLLEAGCPNDTIINAGNIRLDIFKGDMLKLFPSKEDISNEFHLDIQKKWCLFIAGSTHLLESYQLEDEDFGNGYREVFLATNKSRLSYLQCVEEYLKSNKDTIFIYRPHPCMANKDLKSEDVVRLCNLYPENFFAIYKYPLNSWLVNCDICFSFMSSSLIECYFAKTQYFLFRSEELKKNLDYTFFHNFKFSVSNYTEFERTLKQSSYDFSYIAQTLGYWYDMSEDYTFRKIVDYVLNVKDHHNTIEYKTTDWHHNVYEAYAKEFLVKIGKVPLFRKMLLSVNDNRLHRILGDTDDIVSQNEIEDYMKKLNEIRP